MNKCSINKCAYQELKNGQSEQIAKGNWNDLYIGKEDNEYYIEAQADGNARIKIDHCPFCGRKLGEN